VKILLYIDGIAIHPIKILQTLLTIVVDCDDDDDDDDNE